MYKKIALLMMILFAIIGIFFFIQSDSFRLKQDHLIYEYGKSINITLDDLVDMHQEDKQDIKMESTLQNEKGKNYPAIGHYTVTLRYRHKTLVQSIDIQDTTAPTIQKTKDIYVEESQQNIDYQSAIQVTDLSKTNITFDDSQLNIQKPGEYHVTVIAKDDAGNQSEEILKVCVYQKKPRDEYVRIRDYIPSIHIDLRYATENNFTKTKIYNFQDAYLRYGTIQKLKKVQDELWQKGYSLKIWDAYRPLSAQQKLWDVVSNPRYVANPKTPIGHNLGGTVDITLAQQNGKELAMPTGFDDFSLKADRDYRDIVDQEAVDNVELLEKTMQKYGFKGYKNEWWDYSDTTSYVFDDFQPPKGE